MAFPVIAGTATTDGTTAATSCVVNLPGSIAAGDLLLVIFRSAGSASATFPNEGTDWTRSVTSTADASDDITIIGYRQADGTEGATITITTGTSSKFAAIAWRITGAELIATQPPQFSATVTGASATPNPGNLVPTGGAKDYLWLWLGGWEGEQTSPPASTPTNYSNAIGANSGTAGVVATNCRVASASRTNNAASEDPGSWTISASDDWCAFTCAIHPATPTFGFPFPRRDRHIVPLI